MPIIRNFLNVQGSREQTAALLRFISHDAYGVGSVDFRKITPMPPWVFQGSVNQSIVQKLGETGCARGWCKLHWSTEQNALRPEESAAQYDGGTSIRFATLHSGVRSLMQKLSILYPPLYVDYLWASEDIGASVGLIQYKDGVITMEHYPQPFSTEAIDQSLDILGGVPSDYGLILDAKSGQYIYRHNH